MKKIGAKLKALVPSRRKIIQLYMALLFNANLKGFVSGKIYKGDTKAVCAPGINCYSCPGAVAACPLGSLQGAFSADRSTLYYVGGILLLYCILFGRFICGWLCPFGLIQELLYKIKTPKVRKGPITRILSFLKYVILVFFVLIVPITYAFRDTALPAFCKYICPAGTIEGGIALLSNKVNASQLSILGPIFTWKFLLMVSVLVACIFIFRLFCRFLCPLGALYGLFNKISVFGVKVDNSKCTHCNLCVDRCKMDIRHVGDQECISCGECIPVCPTKAITWKGILRKGGIPWTGDQKARLATRILAAVVMVAILVGAIAYYWVTTPDYSTPDDPATSASTPASTDGTEPATDDQREPCYSYPLKRIYADGISEETVDPSAMGTVTIINFWGTWCGPCTEELPYFDQIATDYAGTVTVIAIHTATGSKKAPAYIEEHYPESKILFALDETDSYGTALYYTALGGSMGYPYTVILDANGCIAETFIDAVEYADLQAAIEALL